MKIAIDLTQIPDKLTGVGFYMENLVKALALIDASNDYIIFVRKPTKGYFKVDQPNFKYIIIPTYPMPLRVLWEQLALPLRLLAQRCVVLHSPHYTTPLLGWWFKRVVTFPDLTFYLFPQMHQKFKTVYFQAMMRLSSRIADAIISISYSTSQDIARIFITPAGKINTIHLAASSIYRADIPGGDIRQILGKYGIPEKYILYVGTIEPRKNILGLVKAYLASSPTLKAQYKLVIVGKKGWHYAELFTFLEDRQEKKDIIFTGYAQEEDLPYLFNGASLFVYPSFYEGFGIPVLEAMACGVPVITSNISSMPEVVGKAGLLVDPNNHKEISSAMEKALTDVALREKMRTEGLKQEKQFSWEKCAGETLRVYEKVVRGGKK